MTVTQYVCSLAWTSTFGAVWFAYLKDMWSQESYGVIVFSFMVAIIAGLITPSEVKK